MTYPIAERGISASEALHFAELPEQELYSANICVQQRNCAVDLRIYFILRKTRCLFKGKTLIGFVWKRGAEENVWNYKEGKKERRKEGSQEVKKRKVGR